MKYYNLYNPLNTSLVYLAKVDKVYFHGEAPPAGELWDRLMDMDSENRIQHVFWNRPFTV